ncbi:hypothetical protein SeMB42_g07003 [Synchytrium endobioticum]|uniref:Myb-like domain-containing protein n=1 Tax=Synchytrium endobioticum TaxID=286115 RepID=A0A507CGU3_9FUNG|nr:hypothetical protein SeMB42_g07003 [Synchytrium endobioticum]TPX37363.1 hypothetical protein SeLEV6574_g07907 [Synchytrium endobioticum]
MDDVVLARRSTKQGRFQPRVPQKPKSANGLPSASNPPNKPHPSSLPSSTLQAAQPDQPTPAPLQNTPHIPATTSPASVAAGNQPSLPLALQPTQPATPPSCLPPPVSSSTHPPLPPTLHASPTVLSSTPSSLLTDHSQKRPGDFHDPESQKRPRILPPPLLKSAPTAPPRLTRSCVPPPLSSSAASLPNRRSSSSTTSITGPHTRSRDNASPDSAANGARRRHVPMEESLQSMKIADIIQDKFMFGKMSKTEAARLEKIRLRAYQSPPKQSNNNKNPIPNTTTNATSTTSTRPAQGGAGPQLVMVNGVMTLDQTSLIMRQEEEEVEHEVVDETTTKLITSASFRKNPRANHQKWSKQETELFYECLSWFGTDFGMISNMFPGRSRPQIKTKFNNEEKCHLQRINNALLNKKSPSDAIRKRMEELTTARVSARNAKSEPLPPLDPSVVAAAHANSVKKDDGKDGEQPPQSITTDDEQDTTTIKKTEASDTINNDSPACINIYSPALPATPSSRSSAASRNADSLGSKRLTLMAKLQKKRKLLQNAAGNTTKDAGGSSIVGDKTKDSSVI